LVTKAKRRRAPIPWGLEPLLVKHSLCSAAKFLLLLELLELAERHGYPEYFKEFLVDVLGGILAQLEPFDI